MYLLMIDESGTPRKPDKEYPRYFVIAGVIIPAHKWSIVRDAVQGMKIRYGIRGEMKWRYFSPSNNDDRNPMRKLDQIQRDAIRSALYGIISGTGKITCLASVCSAQAAYAMPSVSGQADIYHLTYKVITERFQYFLQEQPLVGGQKPTGIIVSDHRGAQDDAKLRAHHQMLLHASGGTTSQYKNLVESLFLQPSHQSIGIQLADMVAGAVWRKYERNDDQFYTQIAKSFRKSRTGVVTGYGIAHVPKAGWV